MRSGPPTNEVHALSRTITGEPVRSDISRPTLYGRSPGSPDSDDYVSDALGWWFAGLVDGEGCFSITALKAQFIIGLRDDDRPMLERVRADLGGPGKIYCIDRGANDVRRPMARWNISRRNELLWLTRFFDFFELQSKKRRDYDVWREAVIDWYCSGLPASLEKHIEPLKDARKYQVVEGGS